MNLFISSFLLFVFSSPSFSQFNLDSLLVRTNAESDPQLKQAIVDSFMTIAREDKIPIIEDTLVTFIFKKNVEYVSLGGDFNNWGSSFKVPMAHIDSTDFWYEQKVFEKVARFDYNFLADGKFYRDKENDAPATGFRRPASELAMPEYIQPWELSIIDSVAKGRLESVSLDYESEGKKKVYRNTVYLPAGYDPGRGKGYPVVYLQDGNGYLSPRSGRTPIILDNLIHFKKIKPVIVVFTNPYNRTADYLIGEKASYSKYFVNTLRVYIDSVYNTIDDPKERLVMGPSYGGNISIYIAYNYSNVFGNCALNSAAFRPTFDVFYLIANGVKREIDFYAIWGTYEYPIYIDMRDLRNRLVDKGYNFEWGEFPEGHNWGFWRSHTDEILIHFFPYVEDSPTETSKILEIFTLDQNYPNPFNPETVISYELKVKSDVKIDVFDVLGRKVKTLVNKTQQAGKYSVTFNAAKLASGVYYYKLKAGKNFEKTRKMLLVR